jgi:peptide deformylase
MIRDILQLGATELRQESASVSTEDSELGRIWCDLEDTIRHVMTLHDFKNTVGLSAVQIGVLKRQCLVRFPDQTWRFIANPVVLAESGEVDREYEGCLSFFDKRGLVPRPHAIRLHYLDRSLKQCEEELSGWAARIVLHEIDHMNGVLYCDRMEADAQLLSYEAYRKLLDSRSEDGTPNA